MKNSKKILFSIIALVVAVVAATTSTYAWFTTNDSVVVDTFNLDVKSDSDTLLIAVVKAGETAPTALTNYKYTLSSADILAAIGDVELDAVTSDTAGDTLALKKVDNTAADEGTYASFDLYFATTKIDENTSVYIKSIVLNSVSQGNIAAISAVAGTYAEQEIEVGNEITANAKDAVRIAFGTSIYEESTTAGWGTTLTEGNIAVDQYNALMAEDVVATAKAADFTSEDLADENGYLVGAFETTSLGDKAYLVTKCTVTIWLEGYDADCLNSILDDQFSIKFTFKQAA